MEPPYSKVQSFAPAKIILSGEHAVVYQKPALACAVNRHAGVTIQGRKEQGVVFHLRDIKTTVQSTVSTLRRIRDRLRGNFHQFAKGNLSIRHVLSSPWEIFQYSLISVLEACRIELKEGLHIDFQSTIPIGCGMGSSAATAVSFLKAVSHYLGLNRSIDWLEKCVYDCEQLQHGFPSGIDASLALRGGCILFQKGTANEQLTLPKTPFWLIHTGTPLSKTGECVEHVRKHFSSSAIWSEFETITLQMKRFIETGSFDHPEFLRLISENQTLLEKIDVVPDPIMRCIQELKNHGIFAKVCGAGAVRGDRGGILAAFGPKPDALCQRYGFTCFSVHGEKEGVRVV